MIVTKYANGHTTVECPCGFILTSDDERFAKIERCPLCNNTYSWKIWLKVNNERIEEDD